MALSARFTDAVAGFGKLERHQIVNKSVNGDSYVTLMSQGDA